MTHYHRSKVKCLLTFSSDASTAIFGGLFCTAVKLDSPVSLVRRFAAEVIHTWPKTTITQFQFLPRATTLGNKLGMHWLTWNAVQSYFHDKFVKPKLTNRHFSTPNLTNSLAFDTIQQLSTRFFARNSCTGQGG